MKSRSREEISRRRRGGRIGRGVINTLIDKLPFELHLPGYNYCGPGTKLDKRLQRGDKGINLLDEACKEHDIAYSLSSDIGNRHEADKKLEQVAVQRLKSKDASFGEKVAASTIAASMKVKTKLGMGVKRLNKGRKKRVNRSGGALSFTKAIKKAREAIARGGPLKSLLQTSRVAYNSLRKGKHKIRQPRHRVIPIPKRGGLLPLIPLFAALGALGSLGGGAAAIAKAVTGAKAAREQLEEAKRHNKAMEEKAVGSGFYIKPYKKGCGLYLSSDSKNF